MNMKRITVFLKNGMRIIFENISLIEMDNYCDRNEITGNIVRYELDE